MEQQSDQIDENEKLSEWRIDLNQGLIQEIRRNWLMRKEEHVFKSRDLQTQTKDCSDTIIKF